MDEYKPATTIDSLIDALNIYKEKYGGDIPVYIPLDDKQCIMIRSVAYFSFDEKSTDPRDPEALIMLSPEEPSIVPSFNISNIEKVSFDIYDIEKLTE